MASETEASCESDPNFAIICAFMQKFGESCGIESIDFVELQQMLENNQEVPPELVNLHIKLLRKTKKNVTVERWERALINMCHTFSSKDAWEIERFGYKKTRLQIKLRALKELLEMQFDYNTKFKNEVNRMTAEQLRSQPLGRDKLGRAYWFQTDNNYQLRIYKEDQDEETWNLIAKDREGLMSLISELTDGDSKLSSDSACNEDSNSLLEKPFIDTGQNESSDESKPKEEETNQKAEDKSTSTIEATSGTTAEVAKLEPEEVSESNKPKSDAVEITVISKNEPTQQSVEDKKEEEKPKECTEVKRPLLRIKSLSELMEKPKEPPKPNFLPELPELTIIKKPKLDLPEITIVKKPRLTQPITRTRGGLQISRVIQSPLIITKGNGSGRDNNCENPIVGEAIEEPVRFLRGEGSGRDCQTGNKNFSKQTEYNEGLNNCSLNSNLFIGEEIEEPVMYIFGRGMGRDCETGNEEESKISREDVKLKNTDNNYGSPTSQAEIGEAASENSTSHLSNYKLGTVIDTKTDYKSFPPRDPNKKSRWDQKESPIAEQKDDDMPSPKKMTFFFGPGSLNVKPSPVLNSSSSDVESVDADDQDVSEDKIVENLKDETANKNHPEKFPDTLLGQDDENNDKNPAKSPTTHTEIEVKYEENNDRSEENKTIDTIPGVPIIEKDCEENYSRLLNVTDEKVPSPICASSISETETQNNETGATDDAQSISLMNLDNKEKIPNRREDMDIEIAIQSAEVCSDKKSEESEKQNVLSNLEEGPTESEHETKMSESVDPSVLSCELDAFENRKTVDKTDNIALIETVGEKSPSHKKYDDKKDTAEISDESSIKKIDNMTDIKATVEEIPPCKDGHDSDQTKAADDIEDESIEKSDATLNVEATNKSIDKSEATLNVEATNKSTEKSDTSLNIEATDKSIKKSDTKLNVEATEPKTISDSEGDHKKKENTEDYASSRISVASKENESEENEVEDIAQNKTENKLEEVSIVKLNIESTKKPKIRDERKCTKQKISQSKLDSPKSEENITDNENEDQEKKVEDIEKGKTENKLEIVSKVELNMESAKKPKTRDVKKRAAKQKISPIKLDSPKSAENITDNENEDEEKKNDETDAEDPVITEQFEKQIEEVTDEKKSRDSQDAETKTSTAETGDVEKEMNKTTDEIPKSAEDEKLLEEVEDDRKPSTQETEHVSSNIDEKHENTRGKNLNSKASKIKKLTGNKVPAKKTERQRVSKRNVQEDSSTTETAVEVPVPETRSTRQTRQTRSAKCLDPVPVQPIKAKGKVKKAPAKSDETGSTDSPVPLESVTIPDADSNSAAVDNVETDPLAVSEEETKNPKPTISSLTSFSFDYDPNSPAPPVTVGRRNLRKRGREIMENNPEAGETSVKKPKMKGKRAVDLNLRKSVEEKRQQEVGDISSDENESVKPASKKVTKAKVAKKGSPKKKAGTSSVSDSDNAAQKLEAKAKQGESKTKRLLKNLGVKEEDMSAIADSAVPMRQSRRLAQIKIKEEATRRKIDEDDVTIKKKKKKVDDKVKRM